MTLIAAARAARDALSGWLDQPEDAATYDACMERAQQALADVSAAFDAAIDAARRKE